MPRPPIALPKHLSPLHLYRHLIRESSYLPPAWRDVVTTTIRQRFRRHRKHDPRSNSRISSGINTLRSLRAANSGDKVVMERLILDGFGRTGPKRRQLVQPFVLAQGPSDSGELADLLEKPSPTEGAENSATMTSKRTVEAVEAVEGDESGSSTRSIRPLNTPFFEKWDTQKLKQLFKSQKAVQTGSPVSWARKGFKLLQENRYVPKTNFWGKPPSQVLVNAKKAKFWLSSVNKMMPPLGKGEWELLAQLSDGAQDLEEWRIPERRVAAKPVLQDESSEFMDWDWEGYASKPAAVVERSKVKGALLRNGQTAIGPYQKQPEYRPISKRWFKRTYSRTWQQSPLATQDQRSLKYSFSWGSPKSGVASPTEAQLEIFNGVDSKGQMLGQQSKS